MDLIMMRQKLHETNPDWYPNPDESTIVKGKELKEARADYQALVRRGNLKKVTMYKVYLLGRECKFKYKEYRRIDYSSRAN